MTCTTTGTMLLIALAVAACNSNELKPVKPRVTDAGIITSRYAASRLSEWNVEATAAGPDCGVLVIRTSMIMDDSMIEAMHYGAGAYDVYDGGVQKFARERGFRGVAYRDGHGEEWKYDDVPRSTAELEPCR